MTSRRNPPRSTSFRGVVYHGSTVREPEDIIREFSFGWGDYDAVWFTPDEEAAEEFSERFGDEPGVDRVVYRLRLNLSRLARIEVDDIPEMEEESGEEFRGDIREAIRYLRGQGFRGWTTQGSIGYRAYQDLAVFDGLPSPQAVKVWTGSSWTPYMGLSKATEFLKRRRGSR